MGKGEKALGGELKEGKGSGRVGSCGRRGTGKRWKVFKIRYTYLTKVAAQCNKHTTTRKGGDLLSDKRNEKQFGGLKNSS